MPRCVGPTRYEVLEKFIKEKGWDFGIELGVYEGKTFLYLLKNCPKLQLIGVDAWESRPDLKGKEHLGANPHIVKDMGVVFRTVYAEALGIDPNRFMLIQGKTNEVHEQISDNSVDFIFIDACHMYESVKEDILNWYPKLKPEGYLFGHDRSFPSVRKALDELLPGWKEESNDVWYIPKSEIRICRT